MIHTSKENPSNALAIIELLIAKIGGVWEIVKLQEMTEGMIHEEGGGGSLGQFSWSLTKYSYIGEKRRQLWIISQEITTSYQGIIDYTEGETRQLSLSDVCNHKNYFKLLQFHPYFK